jgi:toxin ParE1/3/4
VRVVLTRRALADLDAIADYIGQDSPQRALDFTRALRDKCKDLGDLPEAWPVKQGWNPMGARIRHWRGYLIVYVVLAQRIDVLHVVNGARDLDALLGGGAA